MISKLTVISATVGDRPYHLLCDPMSPIADLKEAVFQFSKLIAQHEDLAKEKAEKEKQRSEEKPEEESQEQIAEEAQEEPKAE